MQNWKALIDALQADPYARDATLLDFINEPDSRGLGWNDTAPIYEELAGYAHSRNPGRLGGALYGVSCVQPA